MEPMPSTNKAQESHSKADSTVNALHIMSRMVIWDSSCKKPRDYIIVKPSLKSIFSSEFLTANFAAVSVSLKAGG